MQDCLAFFEKDNSSERLNMIYETIAICAKRSRQYKKSSETYKKMIEVLASDTSGM